MIIKVSLCNIDCFNEIFHMALYHIASCSYNFFGNIIVTMDLAERFSRTDTWQFS